MLLTLDTPTGERKLAVELHCGPAQATVVWVDEDDALRLVGAGLLLDAAGAAEVLIGDRQATRDEVLAYLLRDDRLTDVLAPLITRGTAGTRDIRAN